MMFKRIGWIGICAILSLGLLGACSGVSETELQVVEVEGEPVVIEQRVETSDRAMEAPAPQEAEAPAEETGLDDVAEAVPGLTNAPRAGQLIIKNADIHLLVEDSQTAIDRLTQIVGDSGGYIISSREWFQDWDGENYKFATITFAVPVDRFERSLVRLRDIAIRVLDEKASGEDVTQEFVDLESRLSNLEATRDRIRGFLEQADSVEEALRVNEELAQIESQIEETRGRMNYLSDRASFSTITATIEPELPEIVPTPTPTASPTPTAIPSPTPTPWTPGTTFNSASHTLTNTYQGLIDALIWVVVVVLPILAPPALIAWLVWRLVKRLQNSKSSVE